MAKPYRTKRGDRFSEGARLLGCVLSERGCTQAQITLELGAPEGAVNAWLFGDKKPSADAITKIFDVLGIPADSWGRPPNGRFVPPVRALRARKAA